MRSPTLSLIPPSRLHHTTPQRRPNAFPLAFSSRNLSSRISQAHREIYPTYRGARCLLARSSCPTSKTHTCLALSALSCSSFSITLTGSVPAFHILQFPHSPSTDSFLRVSPLLPRPSATPLPPIRNLPASVVSAS